MTGRSPDLPGRITGTAGWREGRILDLRPAADFASGHLRGAISHPLPDTADLAADLPSIFLPPREMPLLVVVADVVAAGGVATHLAQRGRAAVEAVALDSRALAGLPPHMVETGPGAGRLWEPPEWLHRHRDLLPPPALGPVVDLGCGSGRAAVWLSLQGYAVTGYDHQPEALALGGRLAAAAGCRCRFRTADLREEAAWPVGPWSVVVACRFLQRDMLAAMVGRIRPGGVAVIRTFRDAPGYDGHPHPRHRLHPGELPEYFPRHRFEVLAHAEDFDPDGRPAAGIIARRI